MRLSDEATFGLTEDGCIVIEGFCNRCNQLLAAKIAILQLWLECPLNLPIQ